MIVIEILPETKLNYFCVNEGYLDILNLINFEHIPHIRRYDEIEINDQ